MDKVEIKKIANILYTKINKELKDQKIDLIPLDIEKAIFYHEDLNQILNIPISFDFNDFYHYICIVRIIGLKNYSKYILETTDVDVLIKWLPQVLECFTYIEGLELKRAFLKVMTNFTDLNVLENQEIDRFFCIVSEDLKKQRVKSR